MRWEPVLHIKGITHISRHLGPKRKAAGGWRKLHNEGIHHLHPSLHVWNMHHTRISWWIQSTDCADRFGCISSHLRCCWHAVRVLLQNVKSKEHASDVVHPLFYLLTWLCKHMTISVLVAGSGAYKNTECHKRKGQYSGEVIVSVILTKRVKKCIWTCVLFRTVSEIELCHCTLYRRATRHVLTLQCTEHCTDEQRAMSSHFTVL
jgi:hypothetical protein